MRRFLTCTLGMLMLARPALAQDPVPLPGKAIFLGGGPDPEALLAEGLNQAAGTATRVVLLPMASARPEAAALAYEKVFRDLGVVCETLPIRQRGDAAKPGLVRTLAAADLVFLTGGDQNRLREVLSDTPLQGALAASWRRGQVLMGTSGGAMAWGSRMLAGGSSAEALDGQAAFETKPGLDQLPDWLVDTHLTQKNRLGRLVVGLARGADRQGLGIDEQTMARLDGQTLTVHGTGAVHILRPAEAYPPIAAQSRWTALGPFRWHRLIGGESLKWSEEPRGLAAAAAAPGTGGGFLGFGGSAREARRIGASGQPVTLLGMAPTSGRLPGLASFVRDAGGTQASILLLAGRSEAPVAEHWKEHLLLAGARKVNVLVADLMTEATLSRELTQASGLFLADDGSASILKRALQDGGRLRALIQQYGERLPLAASGPGLRSLGDWCVQGVPGREPLRVDEGIRLVRGMVAEGDMPEAAPLERLTYGVLKGEGLLGLGLSPGSSLRLDHDQVQVMGTGQAWFVDGQGVVRRTIPPADSTRPVAAIGLTLSLLPPEGVFDVGRRRPRR
jgi:cyanophycinase